MVVSIQGGNPGQRCFQYAFARILAETLDLQLQATPIPGMPNTRKEIKGKIILFPSIGLDGDSPRFIHLNRPCKFPLFADNSSTSQIVTNGSFRNWRLYEAYRTKISEDWFFMDKMPLCSYTTNEIVISLRFNGDYIASDNNCDQTFSPDYIKQNYKKILRKSIHNRLKLWVDESDIGRFLTRNPHLQPHYITDTPSHQAVQNLLQKFPGKLSKLNEFERFQVIKSSPHVLLMESDWDWWACFCNLSGQIYYFETKGFAYCAGCNMASVAITGQTNLFKGLNNWHQLEMCSN